MNAIGQPRTKLKSREYFEAAVKYNESVIERFGAIISSPGTGARHRQRLSHSLFKQLLEQAITLYSGGYDLDSIKQALKRAVDALEAYRTLGGEAYDFKYLDQYVVSLWLVSLALLLGCSDTELGRMVSLLENEGRDAIYECIVGLRLRSRKQTTHVLHPDPYGVLWAALQAKDARARESLMLRFLSNYYESMKLAYWHDTHKREDPSFFGYWCFELAALVSGLAFAVS